MGKCNVLNATLFQSKLAPHTSYVLGAKLPRGLVPEARFKPDGEVLSGPAEAALEKISSVS